MMLFCGRCQATKVQGTRKKKVRVPSDGMWNSVLYVVFGLRTSECRNVIRAVDLGHSS